MMTLKDRTVEISKEFAKIIYDSIKEDVFINEEKNINFDIFYKKFSKDIRLYNCLTDNLFTVVFIFPRRLNKKYHVLSFSTILHPKDEMDYIIGKKIIASRLKHSQDFISLIRRLFKISEYCTVEINLPDSLKTPSYTYIDTTTTIKFR